MLLESVELGQARADITKARARVRTAKDRAQRQAKLVDAGVSTEQSYSDARGQLAQARAELQAARARTHVYAKAGGGLIRSPLDGTVVRRHAIPGEVTTLDRPLFVVANLDRVWITGRIFERDISSVKKGQAARVTLAGHPNRVWSGTVDFVADVADEQTRALPVRVELDNPERELKPGLFATLSVSLTLDAGFPMRLAVPADAVQDVHGASVVFVSTGPQRFELAQVQTGSRSGSWVEIESGVKMGDSIATGNTFVLKSVLLRGEIGEGHAH